MVILPQIDSVAVTVDGHTCHNYAMYKEKKSSGRGLIIGTRFALLIWMNSDRDFSDTLIQNAFKAIIAAIGDAMSIQDTDFRILMMNPAAKEMFGDRIGEYCYRVFEQKDRVCEDCPLAKSFADGRVHREERSNPTRPLHVEITASPVRNADGRIIAGIEVVRNITERKVMESKLRESRANIKTLRGIIPICAWCKKVREDSGYWKRVETYIQEHSDASFTHGICPDCLKKQDPSTFRNLFGNENTVE
jgi:PAS domain S-box-containing protein